MNLRPSGYEPDELPAALLRDICAARRLAALVERDGFEPSKAVPTDLQSAPFGHSGTPPCIITNYRLIISWSRRWDLNPQPADYKSAALPVELRRQMLTLLS